MRTTLKRIEVGSAFRVGVILYGLLFAVFGLLFVLFQSLLLNSLTNLMRSSNFDSPNLPNTSALLGVSVLSLLCFYGVGIVAAAIFGGIQMAILAVFYNLTARWIGGLSVELQTDDAGLLDDIARDSGAG
jgi:Na+-driven multidrug efflux pump